MSPSTSWAITRCGWATNVTIHEADGDDLVHKITEATQVNG
jgi:hypothetical protein